MRAGALDRITRIVRLRPQARRRLARRIVALLAYIDANPAANRHTDSALARLDDLVGEAGKLRSAL